MMLRSKGPVWHKKQKDKGIIPEGLRGIDKQATWSKSNADGWVYGHGTFSIVTHDIPVLCIFKWMKNCGNESKKMRQHLTLHKDHIKYACMDSKADDSELYSFLKTRCDIQLITSPRKRMNKTPHRRKMIRELKHKKLRKIFRKRSTTVEPMQGLVADIFELDRCWMRGDDSNRWLFAAMGIAVQMAQLDAWRAGRSTWRIKEAVLGL